MSFDWLNIYNHSKRFLSDFKLSEANYSYRAFMISITSCTRTSFTILSDIGIVSGYDFTVSDWTNISRTRMIRPARLDEIKFDDGTYRGLSAVKSLNRDSLGSAYSSGLTRIINSSTIRIYSTVNLDEKVVLLGSVLFNV